MRRTLLALLLVAILAALLLGCEEKFDYNEDPTLEEILEIGKGYLRAGDGGSASEAFMAAMKLSPTCGEAKYGLLIARNLQFLSMLDELFTLISNLNAQSVGGEVTLPDGRIVQAELEPIGDYIQEFLAESAAKWYEVCEDLYLDLLTYPDPSFEIDHFSIGITGILDMQFGGRLDRGDLHFFGVMTGLVRGLVNFVLAHDINYDFFNIAIPEMELNFDNLDDFEAILDLIESLGPIVDLLESMLNFEENPDFLYLKGNEGVARMQAAGQQFGLMFYRMHLMIEEVYRETSQQTEGTVHYLDADSNQAGDRLAESLVIPGFGTLDAGMVNGLDVLCALTATAMWDHTVFDIDPYEANPFYLSFANDLLIGLDILPLVIDEAFIEDLLGIDLDALVQQLLPQLLSLLQELGLDLGDPNDIGDVGFDDDFQIVITGIPEILPIDIGPWFAEPEPDGVRELLGFVIDLFNTIEALLPLLMG